MKKKILSLVLACCLFLLSGCGSVGSVMKNIKAGNVDEANQLYLEKIAGNSEKEFDLEDALQTYIEGLYDDLNSGKVSLAEAQAFASTVYSMDMDSSSYTLFGSSGAGGFSFLGCSHAGGSVFFSPSLTTTVLGWVSSAPVVSSANAVVGRSVKTMNSARSRLKILRKPWFFILKYSPFIW